MSDLAGTDLGTLSGKLTISGTGYTNTVINGNSKGGITVANGTELVLKDLDGFNNFNKDENGGAVKVLAGGKLTVDNVSFSNNTASNAGGAIWNKGTIESVTGSFESNTATNGSGGAIRNGDDATIGSISAEFTGNKGQNGGAIYNDSATITSISGTFTSNTTTSGSGGAIRNGGNGSIGTISSNFTGNIANENGGAIYNSGTITNITDSSFTDNIAKTSNGRGGAIWTDHSITINAVDSNVTFSGNKQAYVSDTSYTANDIYMKGSESTPITLALNAATDKSITFSSGISGTKYYNIDINNATDNTGSVVFDYASKTSGVNALTVARGTFDNNSVLTVRSGSNDGTIAMSSADKTGKFILNGDTDSVFDNNGSFTQRSLNVTKGNFKSDVSNLHLTNTTITNNDKLTLEGGTSDAYADNNYAVTGSGQTIIDGFVNQTRSILTSSTADNAILINENKFDFNRRCN